MNLFQMKHGTEHAIDRKTGIPTHMKQDFEARSGLSYDDVRIHYSSVKPAELGALAYTQGTNVYIGPGQEKHLPHELVHVAQQKRGDVRPTGRLGNVPVNDDSELERQADRGFVVQCANASSGSSTQIIQRKIGMEYQTVGDNANVYVREIKKDGERTEDPKPNDEHGLFLFETRDNIKVTADGSDLEYVTPAVNTAAEARDAGCKAGIVHSKLMRGQNPGLLDGARFYKKLDATPAYCEYYTDSYVYTLKNLGETAHPQATVGIRIDKISDLLEDLGGTKKKGKQNTDKSGMIKLGRSSGKLPLKGTLAEQKKTMLDAPKEAREAVDRYLTRIQKTRQEVTDYNGIVGLLSLLIAYNKQFLIIAKHQKAAWNAKNAMPVMSRTSLYDIYRKLMTDEDRTIFQESIALVNWNKVPDNPQHSLSGQIILAGQRNNSNETTWPSVSLETWTTGLRNGQDAMYGHFHSFGSLADPEAEDPREAEKKEMLRKFGINSSTDIEIPHKNGILAELRGLERNVPYNRWGDVAEQVALLVNRLNEVQEPEGDTPARRRTR